ncbi:MAG TPA: class I SAM-dependent methyltransferase [Planctomycetota bacterium]|nr:class I SAM-dependent methyltransferase [Planctomycetota bacterium]
MDLKAHKDLLRRQFAVQAKAHSKTIQFRRTENVAPMIDLAKPQRSDRLIDVATGWGFVPLAFAPMVKSVTGVDLTPEMVALARKIAAERGVKNVEYVEGDAEDLRFGPGSFEIATSRFTFHHFGDPEKALFEMKRVLTPDGRIVLYDYLAASDEKKAGRHNEIELARDASHVKMYSDREFHAFFRKTGLEARGKIITLMKRHFHHWMAFVDPSDAVLKRTRKLMEESVEGNKAALGIRDRGGELHFTHTCVVWLLTPKG